MRVDADNVLEAESCNLGVSKERTLEVVVEAVCVVFDTSRSADLTPPPSLRQKVNYHSLLGFLANSSQRLALTPILPYHPLDSRSLG